jgi:hypothetical protein
MFPFSIPKSFRHCWRAGWGFSAFIRHSLRRRRAFHSTAMDRMVILSAAAGAVEGSSMAYSWIRLFTAPSAMLRTRFRTTKEGVGNALGCHGIKTISLHQSTQGCGATAQESGVTPCPGGLSPPAGTRAVPRSRTQERGFIAVQRHERHGITSMSPR